MRKRKLITLTSAVLILLLTVTACGKLEASDVIEQSAETMKEMKGYKWKMDVKNKMTLPEEEMTVSSKLDVEYINNKTFAAKADTKVDGMDDVQKIATYFLDDTLYIHEQSADEWVKLKADSDSIPEAAQVDQQVVDPKNTFNALKKAGDKVKMNEEDGKYLLEVSLSDAKDIKPFMKYALQSLEQTPMNADEVTFKKLNIKIWVDKKSLEYEKLEQTVTMEMPFQEDAPMKVQTTTKMTFKGEVKEIKLPKEAEEAEEIER